MVCCVASGQDYNPTRDVFRVLLRRWFKRDYCATRSGFCIPFRVGAKLLNYHRHQIHAYAKYVNRTSTASDLAKDMRNVFERLFGEINLRRPINIENQNAKKNVSDFSWNKMAEELTNRAGGANAKRAVMQQQKVKERLFERFSKILKKQSDADPQNIEIYYKDFIGHLHALTGLLDPACFLPLKR